MHTQSHTHTQEGGFGVGKGREGLVRGGWMEGGEVGWKIWLRSRGGGGMLRPSCLSRPLLLDGKMAPEISLGAEVNNDNDQDNGAYHPQNYHHL